MDVQLSQKLEALTKEGKIVWWKDIVSYHAILDDCGLNLRIMGFNEFCGLQIFEIRNPEASETVSVSKDVGLAAEEQINGRRLKERKHPGFIPGGCCTPNGNNNESLFEKFISLVKTL
jgi:hypothetical protein